MAILGQLCSLAQDLSMMGAPLPGQHRQQRRHAGIARGTERQRRERMRALAERADDVAETRHRVERRVENMSTHRVVDDIKAPARGMSRNIVGHRRFFVVNEGRTELLDIIPIPGRAGGKDLRTPRAGHLDRDVADPASGALDELSGRGRRWPCRPTLPRP